MKKYTLVVPLSEDLKRVALVEKLGLGPSFIAGQIHFPGGPVQEGESVEYAALRDLQMKPDFASNGTTSGKSPTSTRRASSS